MLFSRYLIHESAASFNPERGGPELRGSRCQEEGRALVSCLPGEAARSAWPEYTRCSSSRRLRGCHLSRFDPRKATCKTCPPFSPRRVAPSFVVGGKAGECVSGQGGRRDPGKPRPGSGTPGRQERLAVPLLQGRGRGRMDTFQEGFSRRYQPSRSCASGRAPCSDRPNDLLMYVLSDASIITQGLVEGQCL